MILDLGDMRGLHIDPETRLAWAQPGLTAIEVTEAAAAHGLAIPFGDSGSVGIAGLTLGGGIGWLVRKHGLTIDALVSVEIVTADGRQLVASETENSDLFWAVRGGGGNFGVVTRFQFRLSPVGMIFGGTLLMPASADVLRSLVPIAASAPRELTVIAFFMGAVPPMPFVAPEHVGRPGIAIMFAYDGDPVSGAAAIEPFRRVATPLAEMVSPMPYPVVYNFTAGGAQRSASFIRSAFYETLDDAAVATVLERMANQPEGTMAFTQVRVLGGAMADVPAGDTAFAHRDAGVMLSIMAIYEDDGRATESWLEGYHGALAQRATGVYSNFLEDEGDARIRAAYPGTTYERLVDVKRRYDPTNLFRRNQNIRPR
jgi:FAD/FMN-containing dehydrogenase